MMNFTKQNAIRGGEVLFLDGARLLSNAGKIFGSNLKRLRGDLSQRELAKKLGVDPSMVHHWESGRSFAGGENLDKICSLFRVPLTSLFDPSFVPDKELNKPHQPSAVVSLEDAVRVVNEHLASLALGKRRKVVLKKS